ncbi:MAG: hypothetical protein JNM43_22240, partial [Planctomycetaceae bacterium]|nr:hypothetical protein [Planctomycetaceae bacterium]
MREPAEHRGSMSSPDPSKVLPVKESNRATVPQVTLLRDIAAIILAMFAGVLTYASTFLWCGGVLFVLGRLKDHRD